MLEERRIVDSEIFKPQKVTEEFCILLNIIKNVF